MPTLDDQVRCLEHAKAALRDADPASDAERDRWWSTVAEFWLQAALDGAPALPMTPEAHWKRSKPDGA